MKTFKEFRADKVAAKTKQPYPIMETSFGSHSLKKPSGQKYEVMSTSFGSHSLPKKGEVVEAVKNIGEPEPSKSQHASIHEQSAPMHKEKLNDDENEAIKDYTDESRGMNGMLHRHAQGHDTSTGSNVSNRSTISHLDTALNKHKTNDDMTVYTGLKSSPSKHFKIGKGEEHAIVHLPAFTSTSTSPKTAIGFSEGDSNFKDENHGIEGVNGHILKIHVPKGTHAMSVKEHSFVPEENEVLLHRGHNIKIHRKPTHLADGTIMWHAHVVGHNPSDLG